MIKTLEALDGKVDSFINAMIENADCIDIIHGVQPKLSWNRFDVAIKLAYLECHKIDESGFGLKCYEEHINAFSMGTYKERGNENKSSLNDFKDSFIETFDCLNEYGFDSDKSIVPLGIDGSILNGAHRIASAVYLGENVSFVKTDIKPSKYNYKFFKDRGVSDEVLDFSARKFIEYSDDCYLAIVWPSAQGSYSKLENFLKKIVYKKRIRLNYTGAHNLLSEAYEGEPWLGKQESNYPGIKSKLVNCFPNFNDVIIYVFQENDLESVIKVKEKIRNIYNLGKHSIHITDSKNEAVKLSSLLFNNNGVHFLNNANPNKFPSTKISIDKFKSILKSESVDLNLFALDSGQVMSLYGVRESFDIDYFSVLGDFNYEDKIVERHSNQVVYHQVGETEMVLNPKYHFIYHGIKFISIQQVMRMKKNRNTIKDQVDIASSESLLFDCENKSKLIKEIESIKYKVLFTKAKILVAFRVLVIKVTQRLGIYQTIKKMMSK